MFKASTQRREILWQKKEKLEKELRFNAQNVKKKIIVQKKTKKIRQIV